MDGICYQPVGVIHSPFARTDGMPIQAVAAEGIAGTIEVFPEYQAGLRDIEGFSHLILLYHLHMIEEGSLLVTPFLDTRTHGIFATRSPKRPNPIGLSTVRLVKVDGPTLFIEGVDMVDGTPVLDIKPYVPHFDDRNEARIGWFAGNVARVGEVKADRRFQ